MSTEWYLIWSHLMLFLYFHSYNVIILVVTYILPISAMSFTYLKIGRELWGSTYIGECCDTQIANIKSKKRVSESWNLFFFSIFIESSFEHSMGFQVRRRKSQSLSLLKMSLERINAVKWKHHKYVLRLVTNHRWYNSEIYELLNQFVW